MTKLPDFNERGESRCDKWYSDSVVGDEMTCSCGESCSMEVAETLSPDPYAIPVCPSCFSKAMDEKYGPSWREKV